jgi:hypothetical protein
MRVLSAMDFDSVAKLAVDRFLAKSGSLEDILAKTAENQELNPEQTRTLVQAANVLAHLALMDQKVDGDKYVDFSPADPNVVVKKIFVISSGDKGSGCANATSFDRPCGERSDDERLADFFGDPPNTETPLRQLSEKKPDGQGEYKLAAEKRASQKEILGAIRTVKKTIEELETTKVAAAMTYTDTLDGLVLSLRRQEDAPKALDYLEKHAVAVYGKLGEDICNRLRELACPRGQRVKTAAVVPANVIDVDHPYMETLDELVKAAESVDETTQAIEFLREKLVGLNHLA